MFPGIKGQIVDDLVEEFLWKVHRDRLGPEKVKLGEMADSLDATHQLLSAGLGAMGNGWWGGENLRLRERHSIRYLCDHSRVSVAIKQREQCLRI